MMIICSTLLLVKLMQFDAVVSPRRLFQDGASGLIGLISSGGRKRGREQGIGERAITCRMMPNEDIMTFSKEEAHWSSFRSAVAGLQHSLRELSFSVEAKTERCGSAVRGRLVDDANSSIKYDGRSTAPRNRQPQSGSDDLCNEDATTHHHPHYYLIKDRWDDENIEIDESRCQHLELIGLEEVTRGACSMNNHVGNECIVHPPHSSVQSSHATVALSIAAQQLAEARLKLALTESERDELEFRLMQGG